MGLCRRRQVRSEKTCRTRQQEHHAHCVLTATGLLPQLMIAALRTRRYLIPKGLHCGAPISTPGDRSLM